MSALILSSKSRSVIVPNTCSIKFHQKRNFVDLPISLGLGAAGIVGLGSFMANRYKVSKPDQYLVRTGLGIKDIDINKQGFQWPFQRYKFIDMHPKNYMFDLKTMSIEKLDFILPGVFTIGPKDDKTSLVKYVRILENVEENKTDHTINSIILGILEGEVRTLSSQMTMEEIFNDRKVFKEKIIKNVQEELDQIGLWIYNANIKELQDSGDSKYFHISRQKKMSEAENLAKIDVADANKKGNIGQKEREADTRQQVAQFESDTIKKENERKQEIVKSTADLETIKADADKKQKVAWIESIQAARMRETELQKEVEQKRINLETERLRALELSKAQVHVETNTKDAEGTAAALKINAEGKATALRLESDALLYSKQKEAEGIMTIYKAQSEGLDKLVSSFSGDHSQLIQYLMLDKGVYESLARTSADAVRGLNPKITIWNTNSDGTSDHSYTKPIADIIKMVPPMLSAVNDQFNFKPMPNQNNLNKRSVARKKDQD